MQWLAISEKRDGSGIRIKQGRKYTFSVPSVWRVVAIRQSEVDFSLPAIRVVRALDPIIEWRGQTQANSL